MWDFTKSLNYLVILLKLKLRSFNTKEQKKKKKDILDVCFGTKDIFE